MCNAATTGSAYCEKCGQRLTPPTDMHSRAAPPPPPMSPERPAKRANRGPLVVGGLVGAAGLVVIAVVLATQLLQAPSPAAGPAAPPPAAPTGTALLDPAASSQEPAAANQSDGASPGTPARSASADPASAPRTCWDHSTVEGTRSCPVPAGMRGLVALSPTLREALDEGRCFPATDNHTVGGFQCAIGEGNVHFAWYASAEAEDDHFRYEYPTCDILPRGDLFACSGDDRVSRRYSDRRIRFEVTARATNAAALASVRLLPVAVVLRGRDGR